MRSGTISSMPPFEVFGLRGDPFPIGVGPESFQVEGACQVDDG